MEKVSIIVPVYNSELTLKKCVDSLVNQTYKNIEIILINDGSNDSSLKILESYKNKYPKIVKIISRSNLGIGKTRNDGIAAASGEYIGFVDSDDYVELDMYEKLYMKAKKENADCVVCDYFELRNSLKTIKKIEDFASCNLNDNFDLINIINPSPWNKLFKKTIFNDLKFPENLKYEDLPTILIALLKANKICKLNKSLYNYYINLKGETATVDYRIVDIFNCIQLVIDCFPKSKKSNQALLKLSYEKFFPYIILSYNSNDLGLMLRFVDIGYEFFNRNFKHWKLKYIFQFNTLKDLLIRIMQTNQMLLKKFIKKRVLKKKVNIIFTHYSLQIGGVEKALVNMINSMNFEKYDITLLLQHKDGEFLNQIDRRVNVKGFNLSKMKNPLIRKMINLIKIIYIILENKGKYDFSACYGTGYKASSLVAYYSSKNNAIWMHTNIFNYIKNKKNLTKDAEIVKSTKIFIKNIWFRKFKNYLFVSKNSKDAFLKIYPEDSKKTFLCHNLIDYKNILQKSKEKIKENKIEGYINIVNVSRHTEYDKKISRIIHAIYKLKDKYPLHLFMIGNGEDHKMYVDMVNNMKLQSNVEFLGSKSNPFPYYLLGDFVILSSVFEGFPTIYTESLTLNIPIVTTDVSDAKEFIDEKYGIVCNNDDESLENAIELFIKKKFKIKEKFDYVSYNQESIDLIERLINYEEKEIINYRANI